MTQYTIKQTYTGSKYYAIFENNKQVSPNFYGKFEAEHRFDEWVAFLNEMKELKNNA